MIAYQADWICPATSPPIRNGLLVIDGERIASVGPGNVPENVERIVYAGCAILPGFVNAHTHLELTLFKGLLENLSFFEWIVRLTRMKYDRCTRDALKASAQLGAVQMLRAGVTAVGEVMDVGTGWEAMREFGLQGIAYQEVFGPSESTAPDALRMLKEKVGRNRTDERVTQRIGVSPHAPYTVSRELFQRVRDYARQENLRMTSHVAESREETLFVNEGAGPFAEFHRKRRIDVVSRGCSPVAYLHGLGLLGPDILLAHAIETDAGDIESIRETGSPVVHCPQSNTYFGHRVAPVAAMRDRGICVSLGTDSAASNEVFDIFAEMRAVVRQQRLTAEDAFRMATIEGARALGLDEHLGSLEAGKRADFIVVTGGDSGSDAVEELVSRGSTADVLKTFVGGREVAVDTAELEQQVRRLQIPLLS